MNNVVIYTRNGCMQCKMTKRYLKEHHIGYEERNINEEPQYVDTLKEQGFKSVPIVMAKEQGPIIGFRPDQLKALVG
ncbi:glutaredoxin-like protein NrdH [Agrilactobacillus fermenti]|uniref:glutaredoxin-like protein NrdH n=1 Tax=Agrilactobacillus fermenti TaxID=2586909 RepID=UPI003A5C3C36